MSLSLSLSLSFHVSLDEQAISLADTQTKPDTIEEIRRHEQQQAQGSLIGQSLPLHLCDDPSHSCTSTSQIESRDSRPSWKLPLLEQPNQNEHNEQLSLLSKRWQPEQSIIASVLEQLLPPHRLFMSLLINLPISLFTYSHTIPNNLDNQL